MNEGLHTATRPRLKSQGRVKSTSCRNAHPSVGHRPGNSQSTFCQGYKLACGTRQSLAGE